MGRPELAREGRVLGRNREQEHVVDRNQGPQQDRDADQQQGRFGADAAHELGAGHFDSRFIMKKTSGRISGRAQTIEAMASPDLVEPQVADAERGQHVREIGRAAAGQQVDAVEVADREDHREQGAGDVERADRRPGDEAEAMPGAGAVDRRRLVELARDGEPAGQQDQGPERQRLPDVHHHGKRQRQRRVVQPVRTVVAGQLEDQRVDHAPFGIEHEADRQDGRDRRHRPGQHEQHRQDLHPPALVGEEARQEERHHHLHVDRHDQEHQRVHHRAQEDRIFGRARRRDAGCAPARRRSPPGRPRRRGRSRCRAP